MLDQITYGDTIKLGDCGVITATVILSHGWTVRIGMWRRKESKDQNTLVLDMRRRLASWLAVSFAAGSINPPKANKDKVMASREILVLSAIGGKL
jgi:hypothetical protein